MPSRNGFLRFLAVVLVGTLLPAAAGAQAPTYLFQWGTLGTGPCQFNLPSGIAVDGSGTVYVADYGNGRVQKLTATGTFLAQWNVVGAYPNGLALDGAGSIYVTCDGNHTVQKFTTDGVPMGQWGGYGSSDGQFNYPAGIAISMKGHVYVADLFGHRVEEFSGDGMYLSQWYVQGPYGLGVDPFGNVLVVANGAAYFQDYYVQKFSVSGSSLAQWGGTGSGPGQLSHPTGLCTDPHGNVFVADYFNHRIQKFTGDGSYLAQWGSPGTGNAQFTYPHSVAVDATGNVYVADQYNHRIQVFGDPPTHAKSTSWGRIKALYR